jgi:hypothetical protein
MSAPRLKAAFVRVPYHVAEVPRSGHPHADEELAKVMNGRALTVASNLDRYRGTSALLRTRNL